jgi:hypothetical protein
LTNFPRSGSLKISRVSDNIKEKSDMEETNRKCCLNCQNRTVCVDGKRGCLLNPDMRVNGRMVCEEWRSDDLKDGGATLEM